MTNPSANTAPQNIAVLGIGLMGFPMGKRLCEAGHQVTAWNRSADKAQRLAALWRAVGGFARRGRGTGRSGDLPAGERRGGGRRVVQPGRCRQRMRAGALVIDMSSIRPGPGRDHARAACRPWGCTIWMRPSRAAPWAPKRARWPSWPGGDAEQVERARPVLEPLGRLTHVGPHGAGQLAKLANQMIVGITIGAVAEALLLCEKGGADMAKVREAIGGGFAESRILQLHGQRMVERDFAKRAAITVQLKDMRNAMATAASLGFDAPITGLFEQLFAQAAEHGLGDLDHSALFVELARRNGMEGTSPAWN